MEFKERLNVLRMDRKLTQDELASKTTLSQSAISSWEKGREPSTFAIRTLAKFFDVTADYLLGLEEDEN